MTRQVAGLGIVDEQLVEAGIAIRMQEAAAASEQRVRVLGSTIFRVAIKGSWRHSSAEGALVANHSPQPAGLGAAEMFGHYRGRDCRPKPCGLPAG
jgi:hypothetical protein